MPNIYVTYRSGDSSSDEAKLIIDLLREEHGESQITLTTADAHADILALHNKVVEHDALLILIGKRFINIVDESGRPLLFDAYDYLHAEVFVALESDAIEVFCILTDGTKMPDTDFFPDNLKALAQAQTFRIKDIDDVAHRVIQIENYLKRHQVDLKNPLNTEEKKSPAKILSLFDNKRKIIARASSGLIIIISIVILAIYISAEYRHNWVLRAAPENYWTYDEVMYEETSVTDGRLLFEVHCLVCHSPIYHRFQDEPYLAHIIPFNVNETWNSMINYTEQHGFITTAQRIPFNGKSLDRTQLYNIYAYLRVFYATCSFSNVEISPRILNLSEIIETSRISGFECPAP